LNDINTDFGVVSSLDKSKNIKKSTYDIKSIITKQNIDAQKEEYFKNNRISDKPNPVLHPFNPNKNVKPMYIQNIQSINEEKIDKHI